ncbi:hypothetical protein AALO_G00252430 [Alosa alosa]|uniref:Uncharacterized protein n=1 Tax=Alosa alosa TaxID=278164 RepID=A0AAV6FSZ1_9TELE|nr:hypothetical protein AALO_G00252430 [Alosa alosa]
MQTDFEKDVDLACQTERGHPFIFKEVNTCNPATITGTLSRISLDEEDDPKLAAHQEGVNFSSLPGNIPPPNLLVAVPPLGTLNELGGDSTPLKKERPGLGSAAGRGVVRFPNGSGGSGSGSGGGGGGGGGGGEGDYMVLPRRTVSLKPPPPPKDESKPLNIALDDPPFPPPPSPMTLQPADGEPVAYASDFSSVAAGVPINMDHHHHHHHHHHHMGVNLNRSYSTLKQLPSTACTPNATRQRQAPQHSCSSSSSSRRAGPEPQGLATPLSPNAGGGPAALPTPNLPGQHPRPPRPPARIPGEEKSTVL